MDTEKATNEILAITLGTPEAIGSEQFRSSMGRTGLPQLARIRLTELSSGINEFLEQMDTVLTEVRTSVGGFSISEIEVSAGIKANGQLTLFGIAGAESGIEGGLVFRFKRFQSHQPEPET